MTAQAIVASLWAQGITLLLADDGQHLVAPAGKLAADQRAMILAHKPELIEYLHAARETTAALLDAAMRRCNEFDDDDAALQQMRDDCLNTPPHLQADLLAYFNPERLK